MGEVLVDEAFIQLEENRPNLALTVDDDELPVIDLSNLEDDASLASVAAQIGHACRTWGFFQVINHGVADEVIENILSEAGKFFELPLEEKRKIGKDFRKRQLGFCEPDRVHGVRQWRQGFDYLVIGYDEDKELTNQWPEYPPELRKWALKFSSETEKLGMRIIGLVSLSLGRPASKLSGYFKLNTRRYTKLHHCPPCPAPHLALGASAHEDEGALALLIQDSVGGLEIKRRADGEWIRVRPIPNAYVVNVGHMMEVSSI
uniref:Fe2OG dioxygenase domain-containing protein n=1 Tax=Kalanchoe fedtschenkoi TaxID=63787 RepID=A0A7N0TEC2_KALFE